MNEEKVYRLCYDNVFLAHPPFKEGKNIIGDLSIYIKYRLFYKKFNFEIFFTKEKTGIGKGVKYVEDYTTLDDMYITDFIHCYFDRNEKDYIKINVDTEKLERLGFYLKYNIIGYYKGILKDNISYPQKISKKEFYKILESHLENFDNIDNLHAQNCSEDYIEVRNAE